MQLLVAEDSSGLASSVTGCCSGNVGSSGCGHHCRSLHLLKNQLVMTGRMVVMMVVVTSVVVAVMT